MALATSVAVRIGADLTDLSNKLDRAVNDLTRAQQRMEQTGKAVEKTSTQSFGKFESGLDRVSGTLGKLALPMAAAGVAAGKMAVDFDQSLHNINSIAGLSQTELGKLGDSFVKLSLDQNKTFEGASALATGFYDIQSSGFAGADGMKVLEASTKAASAGMSNTQTAAGAISATLNAYGRSADDATKVSDVLFQTVNLGVINFEQLAGSIGRVIPSAAAAKVSIEEVGAAVSTMTKSGLAGAQAVTDLNSLISNVIKPSKEAGDAAQAMGLDFSFAALQSKGLSGFMHDVMVATGGNAEAMGKLFTSQEALTAALSITKGEMKGFLSDLDGMQNAAGKTDAAFQEMSKSTAAQFQRLKANFEALGITVGSQLLPRVNDAVVGINELVTAFTKLPKSEQQRWINDAAAIAEWTVGLYAATKATQGFIAAWKSWATVLTGIRTVTAAVASGLGTILIPLTAIAGMALYAAHANAEYEKSLDAQAKTLNDHNELLKGTAAAEQRFIDSIVGTTAAGIKQIELLDNLRAAHADLQHQIVEQTVMNPGTGPLGPNEELDRLRGLLKANEQEMDRVTTHMDTMTSSTERAKKMLSEQATVVRNTGSAFQVAGDASHSFAAAMDVAQTAVALTDDEIKALNKNLDTAAKEGLAAFSDLLNGVGKIASDTADLTTDHWQKVADIDQKLRGKLTGDRRKALETERADEVASYNEALANQLIAQGQELAAQKAHLGQMLINQATALAGLNHVSDERLNEMIAGISTAFGVVPDLADTAFRQISGSLNTWATDSSVSSASVVGDMSKATDAAVDTRVAMDKMAKEYTATLKHNFVDGKIKADDLVAAVSKIQSEVSTQFQTNAAIAAAEVSKVKEQLDLIDRHPTVHISVTADGVPQTAGSAYSGAAPRPVRPAPRPAPVAGSVQSQSLDFNTRSIGRVDVWGMAASGASLHSSIDAFVTDADYVLKKITAIASKYKSDGLKHTEDYADTAGKIIGLIGSGVDAFQRIDSYKHLSSDAVGVFAADVDVTVATLGRASGHFKDKALEQMALYADTAEKVLSMAGTGVDALTKIGQYKGVTRHAVLLFGNDVYGTVATLAIITQDFDRDAVAAAADWAESAGKVLSVIGSGVDGLTRLRDYTGVTRNAVILFGNDVYGTVSTLQVITRDFDHDGVKAAAEWAESAGKVIGIIGSGVDGFTKLADYKGVAPTHVWDFEHDVKEAVFAVDQIARDFETDGVAAAGVWADSAGKVIAIIGGGVDGFTKLSTYSGIAPGALRMFEADLRTVITDMTAMAARFDAEGVAAAAVFGEATGKIIAPISTAIDSFTKLNDYKGVAPAAVRLIANDIAGVVGTMQVMAASADTAGVQAAAAVAESQSTIFASLSAGLSFFTELSDYKGVASKNVQMLLDDITAVDQMTGSLSYQAGAAASGALDWENHLAAYHDRIVAGLNSIRSLNGLTATATIHASTKISEGSSSTGLGSGDPFGDLTPRAGGGPVTKGQGYLIGEHRRPEVFYPGQNGYIASTVPSAAGPTIGDIHIHVDGAVPNPRQTGQDIGRSLVDELAARGIKVST